jgi:hypothetical protein
MSLRIVPIGRDQAHTFIEAWHRHSAPPPGFLHAIGAAIDDVIVGVATTGRPIARNYDDGLTAEVTRVATTGAPNACSILYGASWRAAKARGYVRALTYTRDDEAGASLRAAGWWCAEHRDARPGWDTPGRRRDNSNYDPIGRWLWVIGAWARDVDGRLTPSGPRGAPSRLALPANSIHAAPTTLFDEVAA